MSECSKRWLSRAAKLAQPSSNAGSIGKHPSVFEPMQLTSDAYEQHKIKLALDALRSAGRIRFKVQGASMLPTIWPADILTVESNPGGQWVCGDILMVRRNDRLFVHRLVASTGTGDEQSWVMRGDAMPQNDSPVAAGDVLGKVICIERGKRTIYPRLRVSRLTRIVAWTLCNSDVLRGWVLRLHYGWYHPQKKIGSGAKIAEFFPSV